MRSETIVQSQVAKVGGSHLPRVSTTPAFVIALDATGSMASRIADARDHITEILARVRAQLSRAIQVQFLCYRDYDVFDSRNCSLAPPLLEKSPKTEDAQALSSWLAEIKTCYGGSNFGEAIETALEAAHELATS